MHLDSVLRDRGTPNLEYISDISTYYKALTYLPTYLPAQLSESMALGPPRVAIRGLVIQKGQKLPALMGSIVTLPCS